MIIENNLVVLTFNCCIQFSAFASLDFQCKINNTLCVFTFFLPISYSTIFYSEVYRSENIKAAETLLKFSKYSTKSFYFETYCFLVRTVMRGMFQGTLFRSYYKQIISLAFSDIVFVIITFIFRKQFSHKSVFLLVLLYNFLFLTLDVAFFLHYRFP